MAKGLRNIQFSFGESNLTHFGGLFLIHSFCKKLRLKPYLQMHVRLRQRNQEYQTAEFIMLLLYAAILGLGRIENIQSLQINGVFKKIMGIKKIPDPTAMRRFLYRLTPSAIRQIVRVHNLIQKKIFLTLHTKTSVTFDIDGTVLTVYGRQQRAKVGYNPKKRGRRSYCLMLCFESNREFWYGSLRPGNISQVRVSPGIIKKCLAKLPYPIYRVRIRGDSAFYSHTLIEDSLEKERIGYVIETPVKGQMWDYVERVRYSRYKGDWEAAEFHYQPQRCKRPHRFVVQRRPLPEDPEERLQLKLFERKDYGYRVCITNLKLKPGKIWDFYSQRSQGAEQNIKELKMNYPLAKIPTKNYVANVAYFQILLFAFNIINWFKWLCLPEEYHYVTLKTVREQLLSIPARLTKTGNRNALRFPAGYQYQNLFNSAIENIQQLSKNTEFAKN
jgi:hypothetical protein